LLPDLSSTRKDYDLPCLEAFKSQILICMAFGLIATRPGHQPPHHNVSVRFVLENFFYFVSRL
jgi:hypothetical protein